MANINSVEPINYYYLGFATVLLLVCYYFLQTTKNQLQQKKILKDDIQKKSIVVKTKNGDIVMDPNVFEMHMKRMKDNIIELNKNFSESDCVNIKKYLDATQTTTKDYININTNDINPDFCDLRSRIGLVCF